MTLSHKPPQEQEISLNYIHVLLLLNDCKKNESLELHDDDHGLNSQYKREPIKEMIFLNNNQENDLEF